MLNISKINSLRIEKKLSVSRLNSIENSLNRGAFNTRKFQTDSEKIAKLKNRISEIDSEIFLEKSKIQKQQVVDLNRTSSPSPRKMFTTPPKSIADKNPEILTIPTSGDTVLRTENLDFEQVSTPDAITTCSKNVNPDFQDFIANTVRLQSSGGAISRQILSEQATNILATPISSTSCGMDSKLTQYYNKPIQTSIQTDYFDGTYALPKSKVGEPTPVQHEQSKQLNTENRYFLRDQFIQQKYDPQIEENMNALISNKPNISKYQQQSSAAFNPPQTSNQAFFNIENRQNEPNVPLPNAQSERFQAERFNPSQINFIPQTQRKNQMNIPFQQQQENIPIGQNMNMQQFHNDQYAPQQFVQQMNPNLNANQERNMYQNFNQVQFQRPRDTFLRRLRSIPKFNGESFSQLKEFIDVAETLFLSCTNESELNEFYDQIYLQIRGEARNIIIALNNPDWEIIRDKLLSYFAYLSNKDILTSQLENARQEQNESLSTFADRVRKLLKEKNATYSHMTEEQKIEYNRMARRSFSRGVSNLRLRNRLITRGASSLEDAIAYAIEAENDELSTIPNSELYCRRCGRNGHRLKDCTSSNNEGSDISKLISALRTLGNPNRGTQFGNNPRFNNQTNNFGNRNWNQNNNNRNWSPNNFNRFGSTNSPNNNWNSNNFAPNFVPNWNQNRNWNQTPIQNQNQNDGFNRNPVNSQQQFNNRMPFNNQRNQLNDQMGQNRNTTPNQRQTDNQRQNNAVIAAEQPQSPISTSSESQASEN